VGADPSNLEYSYSYAESSDFTANLIQSDWVPATPPSSFPTFTITGLSTGPTYYFRVTARDKVNLVMNNSNTLSTTVQSSCGGGGSSSGGGCSPSSWSPDPATVCSDQTFTQTSNCGSTRTATGTKSCPTNQNTNSGTTNTNSTVTNTNQNGTTNGNENTSNTNMNDSDVVAIGFSTLPNTLTNHRDISLITTAKGAATMCFWGDIENGISAQTPVCIPYANSSNALLSPQDGAKTIFVQFKNNSGRSSDTLQTSITLDTTAPITPTFSIPSTTPIRNIQMNVTGTGDASWIYISGDISNTDHTFKWTAINASYILTLVGDPGVKTVTIQTKDLAGNVSSFVSHTTNYQPEVPPQNENTNSPSMNQNNNRYIPPTPPASNQNTNSIIQQNANGNMPNNNINSETEHNTNSDNTGNTNSFHEQENQNAQGSTDTTSDHDEDGLTNNDETTYYHTDPNNPDTDHDGLKDDEEVNIYHTDPLNPDTDGDFLNDGAEVKTYHTNPLVKDTDKDICTDGAEIAQHTNPLDPNSQACNIPPVILENNVTTPHQSPGIKDSDGDGLSDTIENQIGTDPKKKDTDGDTFSDGDEVLLYGTNPLDPNDNPNTRQLHLRITNWKNGDIMTGSDWLIQGVCKPSSTISVVLIDKNKTETLLQETSCNNEKLFLISINKTVEDGYYTLLAKTADEESPSLSIMVDKTKNIPPPHPEAVDTVSIKEYSPPYLTATIVIHNQKPTVYGKTVYGATVQATFQSLMTSSSIIADSTAGDFSISSPTPLDLGAHKVILYAVTAEGMRSSTITIPFTITNLDAASSGSFPWWMLWLLLLIVIGVFSYWYFFLYAKKKKKEPAPKDKREEQQTKEEPTSADDEPLEVISESSLEKKK
jgi:hypothetical protein